MKKESFGKIFNGTETNLYTIENKNGLKIKVSDFGATLVAIEVPDKSGKPVDVVLGYDSAVEYEKGNACFGANVGRNANRIADAKCSIEGVTYNLEANDGDNNLHSGSKNSTEKQIWTKCGEDKNSLSFEMTSGDLEQGFPGNLHMRLTYTVTDDNEVILSFRGNTDKTTIANFTNHSYYNLNGQGTGKVFNHKLKIYADYFTPMGSSASIPTGEIRSVKNTPFDFTKEKTIGEDFEKEDQQLTFGTGYDHNFVINGESHNMRKAAKAKGDNTGIVMELYTNTPGMQLYTANFLSNEKGKGDAIYDRRDAFCLEPQFFPNHINEKKFESAILKPDEEYKFDIKLKFTVEE